MKCENCGNEHDGSYGSGRFCSEHCKASFLGKKTGGKKGRVPWNKGLTSETDQRVKKRGEFLSKRYYNGELVQHNKGKHLSPEHRKLISEKRKLYLKEHPEKVPYVLNHSSKESFPERFFREAFTNEGFPKFTQDKYVNGYFLDFAFEGLNKYIEVDGEQHYLDKKIVEHDFVRQINLGKTEWKCVCRIRWSKFQKLSNECKHRFLLGLKSKLLGY